MRIFTELEKRQAEVLDIDGTSLCGPTASSPFSNGQNNILAYRPDELKQTERRRSPRTAFFLEKLRDLASMSGGVVPYAFRVHDRSLRTLDAGCLGFLYNRPAPEISFEVGDDNHIVGVRLTKNAPGRGPTYSLPDLIARGLRPAMHRLVEEAEAGGRITYGEMARHLRLALGMPTISHHHMGYVVGELMSDILARFPTAPLLNLLVMRADSEQAGKGARPFLEERYGKVSSERRRRLIQQELIDVWAFSYWRTIERELFGDQPPLTVQLEDYDRDGKGDNPGHGQAGGESEDHKALKEFVANNPHCLGLNLESPRTETERLLLSGDRMDIQIVDGDRFIGVEVKSWRSGYLDLRRGIYQCVKYKAVMKAQYGLSKEEADCASVLVTERALSTDLRDIAHQLGVIAVVISMA